MRRREFIALLVGSTTAGPIAALAQEPGRIYRLGFLYPAPPQPLGPNLRSISKRWQSAASGHQKKRPPHGAVPS